MWDWELGTRPRSSPQAKKTDFCIVLRSSKGYPGRRLDLSLCQTHI